MFLRKLHGQNDFAEVSKNVAGYKSENNLNHQNNYVERLNIFDDVAKCFNVLAIGLCAPHNYFDGPNKIVFRFVSKFLNTSAKPFFPYAKLIFSFRRKTLAV